VRKILEAGIGSLIALLIPGSCFLLGLFLLREHARFRWLTEISTFPWELWVIAVGGIIATCGGILDWRFHRREGVKIGPHERHCEFIALAVGGVPLFILMAFASLSSRPYLFLIPIVIVALYTAVLICYDEFVFHRNRCGSGETLLHRMLVFGNGTAWLAWMHWCFVRNIPLG